MSLYVFWPILVKVVQGKTNKITQYLSCMVEARASNNLTNGCSGQ